VQACISLIAQGKFKEALEIIRKDIPLPLVVEFVSAHVKTLAREKTLMRQSAFAPLSV